MSEARGFLSVLTGSLATPAAENPTVAMIEAAYRHHGLDARYVNCDVPPHALGDAVRGARAMGWVGFNCSIPHKVAVVAHLDGLGESAAIIGAVNCVVRRGDRFVGENTDGQGFLAALRTVVDPAGKALVVFGAGGAARAIAIEAALAGAASLTIVNRDPERGAGLVELVNEKTPARADLAVWDAPYQLPATTSIVVNATSIGLFPQVEGRLNIELGSLEPHMVVADVIPNPPRTALIRDAQARGCVTLDGLGMLVNQAIISISHLDRRRRRPEGHAPEARGAVPFLGAVTGSRQSGPQATQILARPLLEDPRRQDRLADTPSQRTSMAATLELNRPPDDHTGPRGQGPGPYKVTQVVQWSVLAPTRATTHPT